MNKKTLIYGDGTTELQGCYFAPEGKGSYPAVLVAHDWSGRNDFAEEAAQKMARQGYIGVALDLYGEGKTGHTKEEKAALMTPLVENRLLLRRRLLAGVEALNQVETYDGENFAAIGFCFGGLSVLDLARSGVPAKAIISFHGLLKAPQLDEQKITAPLLILHGYDDPMATPQEIIDFMAEMKRCEAEVEFIAYSNTVHAFTNPQANDPKFGTVYRESVARKAWARCEEFLAQALVK